MALTSFWLSSEKELETKIGQLTAQADGARVRLRPVLCMDAGERGRRVRHGKHGPFRRQSGGSRQACRHPAEAALCKLWASERSWDIVNETMQIRGGRGYETAESLAARGEEPVPVERFLRDCRINTIFEGSSEIMRLFHAMAKHGPKLEREQVLLGRFVDIGTELFAITATCCRAQSLLEERREELLALADHFCGEARFRIEARFRGIRHHSDRAGYKLAQRVMEGRYDWLDEGVVP